jgi:hypothetical protein
MKWGTKAPSEKTLEDYISEHPECLGLCEIGPEEYAAEYQFTLRQVRLPSGIADLVGTTCSQREIVVAELKKGTINYSAVAQVLRYMSDLNATVGSLLSRLVLNGDPLSEFVPRNPAIEDDWKSIVRGVLIGAGVEDDNLVRICRSCNVLVYTYSWHENACSIREVGLKTKSHHSVLEACDEMSTRAIGKLLTSVVMNNLGDGQRENLGSFDAVSAANEYLSGINRGGEV